MRAWTKNKHGYLPAFESGETIGLNPEYAEDYAIAPPEVLFLYHAWQRLIAPELPPRAIPGDQFSAFLLDVAEWQPTHWKQAPKEYTLFVAKLENQKIYPASSIPWEVYRAFIGWKNYFVEGSAINALKPTKSEMAEFLRLYPHYAPNFWQNIVGSSYLQSFQRLAHTENIPSSEIPPFLKAAFYNHLKSLTE